MNETIGTEYVPQKIFDLQLDDLKYRTNTERERMDDRLDKFQAVMEKNFAEMKSVIVEMRGEIKVLDKKIDNVEEKLTGSINGTNKRIDGLEKRFDDMKEHQNKWFTVFGILFSVAAIVAPIAVAIIQRVWK